MRSKNKPTEFAINMMLDGSMILQQSDLDKVSGFNYFNENSPCHIYFICRRPRLMIDPKRFTATNETMNMVFKVQRGNLFEDFEYTFENPFKDESIYIESEYPYNLFKFKKENSTLLVAKTATFLQSIERYYTNANFLDLEILYIGQSYGVDGARTAPDRLKNHSTLQNIYSIASQKNPDYEIWLMLTSFTQVNITFMDGRSKFSEEERTNDKDRFIHIHNKLNFEGINEQQRINFTEAALIRYFQPPYNIEYKNSFPSPAHKTYEECYELDINSISVELETLEQTNMMLFSETIKPHWLHLQSFPLHSIEDRKDMFDVLSIMGNDKL